MDATLLTAGTSNDRFEEISCTAAPGIHDQRLAIVSRYPLKNVQIKRLKACDLRFRSRQRFAMATTVQTLWGDLHVWNVHFDTRINRSSVWRNCNRS